MDEQDPNAGKGQEDTQSKNEPKGGTIVDKTLADIKADADKLAGTVESDGKDAANAVETKVRHAGHDVLDEMEQHLSQFGHYEVAVYHGFLQRLRNLL